MYNYDQTTLISIFFASACSLFLPTGNFLVFPGSHMQQARYGERRRTMRAIDAKKASRNVFKKCWHGLVGLVAPLLQPCCSPVAAMLQPLWQPFVAALCCSPLLQPVTHPVAALLPPCCRLACCRLVAALFAALCLHMFAPRFVIIIFLQHLHCPHLIFFPSLYAIA